MNLAINYAEGPSVHDVMARKTVHDVLALNSLVIASQLPLANHLWNLPPMTTVNLALLPRV